ncbi:hypothetical protein G3N55_02170 [Dissulfurirhabdus thermomarina]|uniref:Thioredoxin family protein n=1 Tax=Dissulfurirhabdus thermomarina TaxID=1765737 RepID=A0A6N9TKM0_DISTH|nr:hypothetical protein [Dissulfurirhabdus thermomarina]NDY41659.1 hypothetical protein [Dissulfurirhabdus thermomarina]NMX24351.1 hypothetical protein [Dissulfurirhabdus thermomarina]
MRAAALAAVLWLLAAGPAPAAFTLPSGVVPLSDLPAARAKARREGKALAFLFVDTRGGCGLCAQAARLAAERLSPAAVVVHVDPRSDLGRMPSLVRDALRSPAAGQVSPRLAVTDAAVRRVIAVVPFRYGKAYEAALDGALRRIRGR